MAFGEAIDPWGACPGVGEHAPEGCGYPFPLTQKPIEVVETMSRLVHRLRGQAPLGFDEIGHPSSSSLLPVVTGGNDGGASPCPGRSPAPPPPTAPPRGPSFRRSSPRLPCPRPAAGRPRTALPTFP